MDLDYLPVYLAGPLLVIHEVRLCQQGYVLRVASISAFHGTQAARIHRMQT